MIKSVDPDTLTPEERLERVKLIDSVTLSPGLRAKRVHELIMKLKFPEMVTEWDMICFCSAYLGMTVQKDSGMLYESLRRVMYCVNQFHYFETEDHEEEEKKKLDYFAKELVNKQTTEKVWTLEDFPKKM